MTLSKSHPRAGKRWVLLVVAVAAMTFLVGGIAMAANPASQSLFELDGNALADAAVAGDDWENIVGQNPSGTTISGAAGTLVASTFIGEDEEATGVDTTYFTGGGSKDVRDVSAWQYNGNSVPDKNQITNAYAAQYAKGGSQFIYFGADRFSNDGDSSLGFWFFKGTVSLQNGAFVGNHQDGDLFIVSDFSNGGSVGTVVAYRWTGGATGSLTGPIGSGGDCTVATTATNLCARVNGAATASPWTYTPKPNIGSPGTFPTNTLFEGGIDLGALSGGQPVCFSSFLVETRSSTSTTAQLKDFALDGFDTCQARIRISPSGVNEVNTEHTFKAKVENSFGGPFQPVANVLVTGSLAAGSVGTLNPATCTTDSAGECELKVNSSTAGVATVNASATVSFSGASETVTTVGKTGVDGPATKRFVDASIQVANTAVNEVNNQHRFDITVTPQAAGTTISAISITPSITPTGYTPVSDTCGTIPLAGPYTCSVTINSSTAGTYTANASTSITFTGNTGDNPLTATVNRTTSGNSALQAIKRFVDARIKIEPPLDTNGIGESHTVTVTVEKDLGAGAGWVAAAGVKPTVALAESAGAVVASKVDGCAATAGTSASGTCTVTFTSNSAGTVTASASVSITIDGQTFTRSTGTAHGFAATSAVKHFVAGTLRWLKHDQDGVLLGGATFQVCRTANWDSTLNNDAGGIGPLLATPVCVNSAGNPPNVLDDNATFDKDATPGEFQLENLILGRYTIRETIAPMGYALDPDTESVDLTLANPSNADAGATDTVPLFVDVRLFKMIVITCNQSTNGLIESTVTLTVGGDAIVKDTLDAADNLGGLTQAQLCGIGGASFGNLRSGTYVPSVVLPKPSMASLSAPE